MKTNIKVNFTDFNTNKKNETVIKLAVRGDLSDEQILTLHKLKAQGAGFACLSSAQMDIDDYDDEAGERSERQGVPYSVDKSGTVDVQGNQMSIDDLPQKKEGDSEQEEGSQPSEAGEQTEGETETRKEEGEQKSEEQQEGEKQDPPAGNVTDLGQARTRRGRQSSAEKNGGSSVPSDDKEEDKGKSDLADKEGSSERMPASTDDDDLPY